MAVKESEFIPLNTKMPHFNLPDTDMNDHASIDLTGEKGLLVVFTCNHCPYAKALWPGLIALSKKALKLGINTVAINPNIHPEYPEDSPFGMKQKIKELKINFPYLIDNTQKVAKAFKAQCTPDIYLIDNDYRLVYHGRFDDNWKEPQNVTREDLKRAIISLADGEPIFVDQRPSMGCSIKWRDARAL